jgi:lipid II:glycine glycyltransferase (peptidoglycan interpeptide bridge formation enzyme)
VDIVESHTHVPTLYGILKESYANSKIPLVDISHFYSVFRELNLNDIRLAVARLDGDVIAASCFLTDKQRVYYWYAGTKRIPGISAMASIVWDAIQYYAKTDKKIFDFCGAGWEGEDYGPGRFKAHFGGTLTNHGRYRKVYSKWRFKLADVTYAAFRGILAPRSDESPQNKKSNPIETAQL